MTQEAQGKGRRAAAIGGIAAVVGLASLALYLERGAVGAAVAKAYLKSLSVPAEVTVDRLSLAGLTASVRIGPAARPDLVLDHVEVDFAPNLGLAAPKIARVRISGAQARITVRKGKLDFGRLQPLIDAASKPAKASGAPPDVRIDGARLIVDFDGQILPFALSGETKAGQLMTARAEIAPTHLAYAGTSADGARLSVALTGTASGYDVRASGGADRLSGAWGTAERANLSLQARATGSPASGVTAGGAVRLAIARLARPGLALQDVALAAEAREAALALDHGEARLFARTAATLTARGAAGAGDGRMVLPELRLTSAGTLTRDQSGLAVAQAVSMRGVVEPSAALTSRLADILGGEPSRRADLSRRLRRVTVALPKAQVDATQGRYRLVLVTPMTLDADHARAALSADRGPLIEREGETIRAGFAAALTGEGLPDVHIDAAQVEVQGGAATGVGWTHLRTDIAGLRGLQLDQAWRLASRGGSTTLRPTSCVRLTAQAVTGSPKDLATGLSGDLCEAGAPLVLWRDGRGRLAGRLTRGAADIPTAQARIEGLTAEVSASFGGGEAVSADVRLTSAFLGDQASPKRFRPLTTQGALYLSHQKLTGAFDIAEARGGGKIARATLAHDLTARRGSAEVAADPITFSRDGLQPGDLSVPAAKMIWKAVGTARFYGRYDWSQNAPVRSSGDARVDLSDFQISAGKGRNLSTALHLTSLGPLESAAEQVATVERIDGITSLTALGVRYQVGADAVSVAEASAQALGGRASLDPLQLLLTPGAPVVGKARVFNLDIGALLKGTDLADSLTLDTRVSGVVPFRMTPEGLRVSDGRLASVAGGRLTIHRKALTGPVVAGAGTMQDIAWQALQDLAFDQMDLVLESRPEGRLGLVFHIRGKHDPKIDAPAVINLIDVLRGRAASTPMTLPKGTEVNLTLDSSLNFDELLSALARPDTNRPSPGAKVSP